MKVLYLSFAPPERWRNPQQAKKLKGDAWKALRIKIMYRDDYTCAYCAYKSEKYQIVDHIDGNPENNDAGNLQVVCQMCNLIKHSGQGCVVQEIVDLYKESKFSQNEVIQLTRTLRDEGKADEEIISYLGLKQKTPFKMDREYLRRLIGFVTSRPTKDKDSMYDSWLRHYNRLLMQKNTINKATNRQSTL